MTTEEQALLKKADTWIMAHTHEMIEDVQKLIRIRSVNLRDTPVEPYGAGCRDVIDAAADICRSYGFSPRKNDYYCCTTTLPGKRPDQIGIFAHLDVVPEGNDWTRPPYEPYVKDGYIIGRGSKDNKGPCMVSLSVLRCLRDLGVSLTHSVLLFLGCAEENGMDDVGYYLAHNKAPVFSYTPDAPYSVCYGEKGVLRVQFCRDIAGKGDPAENGLLDFKGGNVTNSVADRAEALIAGKSLEEVRMALAGHERLGAESDPRGVLVKAVGVARHAAFAEGSVNAILLLASFLAEQKLVSGAALEAVSFLKEALTDYHGGGLDINFTDDISGHTTCIGGLAWMDGTMLYQDVNIRYAIKTDIDELRRRLEARCDRRGFTVSLFHDNRPAYISLESPVVQTLDAVVTEFYGDRFKPHIMGGGTYARKIPNAVGFGFGMGDAPGPFGDGHQPDEGIRIEDMLTAIKVYLLALTRLDRIL
jgi:succinyl-diaminopimelate desuccinylase